MKMIVFTGSYLSARGARPLIEENMTNLLVSLKSRDVKVKTENCYFRFPLKNSNLAESKTQP